MSKSKQESTRNNKDKAAPAETASRFVINDWVMLLTLALMALLQFVFLDWQDYERISPKVLMIILLGIISFVTVSMGLLLVSTLIFWKIGWAKKSTLLRTFIGTVLLGLWLIPIYPTLEKGLSEKARDNFDLVINENEKKVIELLPKLYENIHNFRALSIRDENSNQTGEFATLLEMSKAQHLTPELQRAEHYSTFIAHEYIFFLHVPDNIDMREKYWCLYAWPLSHDRTGGRTFFINEAGVIYWRDQNHYQGMLDTDGPPAYEAYFPGFRPGEKKDPMKMFEAAFVNPIATNKWQALKKEK